MLVHWREDARVAVFVTLLCGFAVYGPIFLWQVVKTVM